MNDWFDDLDIHPSWQHEDTYCKCCGIVTNGKTYCSKSCKKEDNE